MNHGCRVDSISRNVRSKDLTYAKTACQKKGGPEATLFRSRFFEL
jgi:hypothetical protein